MSALRLVSDEVCLPHRLDVVQSIIRPA